MTDEPAEPAAPTPEPTPAARARIEPSPVSSRTDLLPILYLVGIVVLAGAVFYLWQNQPEARLAPQAIDQIQTLQTQIASLQSDITKLQQRPGPTAADIDQLRQQVTALANRPAQPAAATDLKPIQNRLAALEQKPAIAPDQLVSVQQQLKTLTDQTAELLRLAGRVDALEKRPAIDPASLDSRFATVDQRLEQASSQTAAKLQDLQAKVTAATQPLQARVDELERQQKAIAAKAQLAARLQGVAAALAAGEKLGAIPGAPPALARFADQPPPTEASLRASFDHYAAAAQQANLAVVPENHGFVGRLWDRAQRAVTVREGDHVLVGDPIAGTLAEARAQLDTGNLRAAIAALQSLTGPAAKAMAPWVEQAQSLLDARSAIASLAAG